MPERKKATDCGSVSSQKLSFCDFCRVRKEEHTRQEIILSERKVCAGESCPPAGLQVAELDFSVPMVPITYVYISKYGMQSAEHVKT